MKVTELLIHCGSGVEIIVKTNLFKDDAVYIGSASKYYNGIGFNPNAYHVKTYYPYDNKLLIHVEGGE